MSICILHDRYRIDQTFLFTFHYLIWSSCALLWLLPSVFVEVDTTFLFRKTRPLIEFLSYFTDFRQSTIRLRPTRGWPDTLCTSWHCIQNGRYTSSKNLSIFARIKIYSRYIVVFLWLILLEACFPSSHISVCIYSNTKELVEKIGLVSR